MVKIAIYADGADLNAMAALAGKVSGFTTNPSLMAKVGILDYREFAREVLAIAAGKPVSFEVFADDFPTMRRQAHQLAELGGNVYVKVPITNTEGLSALPLVRTLTDEGVKVNVTAVMTKLQASEALAALAGCSGGIVSIFAGRIADTGRDPSRFMRSAVSAWNCCGRGKQQLLWASAREVYNVVQAEEAGADIITLGPELIAKLAGFGRDLAEYSLETVKQFHLDAKGLAL
jgi:transaldolase